MTNPNDEQPERTDERDLSDPGPGAMDRIRDAIRDQLYPQRP